MSHDFREEAEREAQEQVHPASDINRTWFVIGYQAGAQAGYERGNSHAQIKNELIQEKNAEIDQLKQQLETYKDAIKDKNTAYALMKEACEDFKQQLADMKWEYENACKFATQFEHAAERHRDLAADRLAELQKLQQQLAEREETNRQVTTALVQAEAQLREAEEALKFYATDSHFGYFGKEKWEPEATSGEPENWLSGGAYGSEFHYENGGIARAYFTKHAGKGVGG